MKVYYNFKKKAAPGAIKNNYYVPVPMIRIVREDLREWGFDIGTEFKIIFDKDKGRIILEKEAGSESYLMEV